jgi:hypothetical protein
MYEIEGLLGRDPRSTRQHSGSMATVRCPPAERALRPALVGAVGEFYCSGSADCRVFGEFR